MKRLQFWFDPISPYAYLAFEQLPQVLAGLSYEVTYRPVPFARLLAHGGAKNPVEIEPKRAWMFRHAAWLAHRHGIALQLPERQPFDSLALIRLLVSCDAAGGMPNRLACETVLRHVWRGGADAEDPQRLAALAQALAPRGDAADPTVEQALQKATAEAMALGVFGVPTIEVDGRLFWGVDGLAMAAECLRGGSWF